MARVLAISSQVARGHVGLSAIVPALQRLGHEVVALPTILLSNHPGHAHFAGQQIDPELLRRMLGALRQNGWLADIDAVLTGYLPTVEHVRLAAESITTLKHNRPALRIVCDPVLGDDPKGLYIDAAAAAAIRDELIGVADLIVPNRFELAFLSGVDVRDEADAVAALRSLGHSGLATSIPTSTAGRLSNVLLSDGAMTSVEVTRRAKVPNGTGDLLSALFLGHWLLGGDAAAALSQAVHQLDFIVAASAGADELRLSTPDAAWTSVSSHNP